MLGGVDMICPFRNRVEHEYRKIDGNTYVLVAETEEYPDCYEDKCPFYNYEGSCDRTSE